MADIGLSRRNFLAGTAGAALASTALARPAVAAPIELVHWSWLQASDGEVWEKVIKSFNEAHRSEGVQIRLELVPEEQYRTWVFVLQSIQ